LDIPAGTPPQGEVFCHGGVASKVAEMDFRLGRYVNMCVDAKLFGVMAGDVCLGTEHQAR
jgi:hypothetical protein